MTEDSKALAPWIAFAVVFLITLVLLTLLLPGLKKTPLVRKGKPIGPKEFFTTDQYNKLYPGNAYDPNSPPKGFQLSDAQAKELTDAGYDGCTGSDGFWNQGGGPGCFCENSPAARAIFDTQHSMLQPRNTWSALFGFTPFGLLILVFLIYQSAGNPPGGDNLMTNNYFYSLFYAYLAIFLGPASMMFHIGMRQFGGWFDSFSIHLLFGFALVYNIVRMWMNGGFWLSSSFLGLNLQRWMFLLIFLPATIVVEIICAPGVQPDARMAFDFIIGGIALVFQALAFVFLKPARDSWGWFLGAGIIFVLAVLIWVLSWTQKPLCVPNGFQGHAVWHILCGMGAFFLFMYFRREGASHSS
jgi:hypothetical protein